MSGQAKLTLLSAAATFTLTQVVEYVRTPRVLLVHMSKDQPQRKVVVGHHTAEKEDTSLIYKHLEFEYSGYYNVAVRRKRAWRLLYDEETLHRLMCPPVNY